MCAIEIEDLLGHLATRGVCLVFEKGFKGHKVTNVPNQGTLEALVPRNPGGQYLTRASISPILCSCSEVGLASLVSISAWNELEHSKYTEKPATVIVKLAVVATIACSGDRLYPNIGIGALSTHSITSVFGSARWRVVHLAGRP